MNPTTLGIGFFHTNRTRIRRTPINRFSVRVHPEEALVPPLPVALANRTASVLVQELADHGLSDRMNDRGVRRARVDASAVCDDDATVAASR